MTSEKHSADSITDAQPVAEREIHVTGPPRFTWASLFQAPIVNELNGKSYTLPIFNLRNPYARNFHLSWMGFFVAFLSWFAFPPLLPEAIKADLKLTTAQIGNSNVIALLATLLVRFAMGPMCDAFGPRKCMAAMLIIGAIPSGMAGLVKSVNGLYAVRFFIGILGGTFVPCQAWTTAFFDKNIVGTANALVGGWGNAGGGVTFIVMVALFQNLVQHMTAHKAWRVAYAVVPVPILFFVAALTLIFGTDCPAGKWEDRHNLPASALAAATGHVPVIAANEHKADEKTVGAVTIAEVPEGTADIDVAVSEKLTWATFGKIVSLPYTWLPAIMYMSTFGFELAVDANLANVLFASHSKEPGFGQTKAGYLASSFGIMNIVTRPLGGFLGDLIYRYYGVKGKKWITVAFGFLQGVGSLALGLYQRKIYADGHLPHLGVQMGLLVFMSIFCEMANGTNFSLVPHCNSFNNGVMSGLVGGCGNLGGIFFALIFRFHNLRSWTDAWIISGGVAMGLNLIAAVLRAPPK